ncbi:helix-turn-helix transcriptional regulator [Labedaea rhizosphaerae]|uniref:Putative DNA-binding transcriptional regulator YafY n=1 Tax=Labedaea rhizosphaerae TaxID=598644 RepID=A0A4R6RW16_LABRH|nr:YafY family protein [Labedaea rhizosphaerae]TDP91133.1 putative DNA-binding transcriptional regulator YafY [Labedaea rhizosphaerae]
MRAGRLLSLLLLLQSRGRMSAPELAAELEVSVRTVYRDIESLSASGVPVYADRGPSGGYQLMEGYRTRLTGLTQAEAGSLALAGLPQQAAELGLGSILAAAELKLMAAMPDPLRAEAARMRERFHLDAPGWFAEGEDLPFLAELAAAVWSQQVVAVRYLRWGPSEVERTLRPLGLVLKAGTWYLVAAGLDDDKPRTYRVSRMRAVVVTDDPFTRPAGFDLAGFWAGTAAHLKERLYHRSAVVRLSPSGRKLLFLLGPVVRRDAEELATDAEGWCTMRIPMETLQHGVHAILQLGAEAEVLEPPELRAKIATEVRKLAARYE